jgi:hypothetical protein
MEVLPPVLLPPLPLPLIPPMAAQAPLPPLLVSQKNTKCKQKKKLPGTPRSRTSQLSATTAPAHSRAHRFFRKVTCRDLIRHPRLTARTKGHA